MSWSCYLYFTPASEGTLFAKWSETPVENAMAMFTPDPEAKIPGYLTKNGGQRTELCRNMSAYRIQNFYRGYAEFIKSSVKYNSVVTNIDTDGGSKLNTVTKFFFCLSILNIFCRFWVFSLLMTRCICHRMEKELKSLIL